MRQTVFNCGKGEFSLISKVLFQTNFLTSMNKGEMYQHKTLQTFIEEYNCGYICLLNCDDHCLFLWGK